MILSRRGFLHASRVETFHVVVARALHASSFHVCCPPVETHPGRLANLPQIAPAFHDLCLPSHCCLGALLVQDTVRILHRSLSSYSS